MPTYIHSSDFEPFVRELLEKIREDTSTLATEVLRLGANDKLQDHKLRQLDRRVVVVESKTDQHGIRIEELERLPKARPPHPSMDTLERYDPDMTPGGGIRVEGEMYAGLMRALSELRSKVEESDQALALERASREGAEKHADSLKKAAAWYGGGVLGVVAIIELFLRVIWHH